MKILIGELLSWLANLRPWAFLLAIPFLTVLPFVIFYAIIDFLHWLFGPRSYLNDSFVENFEQVGVFALFLALGLPLMAAYIAWDLGAKPATCAVALILGIAAPTGLYSIWFKSPAGQFNHIRSGAVELAIKAAIARSDDVSWEEAFGESFSDWERRGQDPTAFRWEIYCTKIAYAPPYPNAKRAAEMCEEKMMTARASIIEALKHEKR